MEVGWGRARGDGAAGIGPGGRGRSRRGAHERSASFPASRDRYAGLTGPAVKGSRQGSTAPSRRASVRASAAHAGRRSPCDEPSAAPLGRPPARRGAGAALAAYPARSSDPGRRPDRSFAAPGGRAFTPEWRRHRRSSLELVLDLAGPAAVGLDVLGWDGTPVAALLPTPASTLPAGQTPIGWDGFGDARWAVPRRG